jgi:hypothetical protein
MRSRPKNRTGNKLKQSAAPASSLARRPNARDLSLHRAERRRHGADRLGVAHSRALAEFRVDRDGKMHQRRSVATTIGSNEGASDETLRQLCSLLVAQAPELKAFRIDCLLDRVAREIVGRSIVR